MDANTIDPHPDHEKVDCDSVLQTRSGRQYLRITSTNVQPKLGDISKLIDGPAGRTSKNIFPFLLLPGELRNNIYKWSWWTPRWALGRLRQPPITRVSRQLRHEALGLFYSSRDYWVELPAIADGRDDSTCQRQDPSSFTSEMLDAFTPKPESALQTSSLCFLSRISISIETRTVWPEMDRLIISMSDKRHEWWRSEEHAMRTAGLNWNDEVAVSEAFLEAVRSCEDVQTAAMLLGDDGIAEGAAGAASQVARVLCLMAQHCPQLTTFVLITVLLEHHLCDSVEGYYADLFESGFIQIRVRTKSGKSRFKLRAVY